MCFKFVTDTLFIIKLHSSFTFLVTFYCLFDIFSNVFKMFLSDIFFFLRSQCSAMIQATQLIQMTMQRNQGEPFNFNYY